MRIGVLGLGRIGSSHAAPLAGAGLGAGEALVVSGPAAGAARAVAGRSGARGAGRGARGADSPAELTAVGADGLVVAATTARVRR